MSIVFSTSSPTISTVSAPLLTAVSSDSVVSAPLYVTTDSVVSSPTFVTSLNLNYSKPLLSMYSNLEDNEKVKRTVVKHFMYKTLDKWLYGDLIHLLGYVTIKDKKIDIISDLSKYSKKSVDSDSDSDVEKKVNFIEKFIISKNMVRRVLDKYVSETGASWYDLPGKNDFYIKQIMEIALKKRFKKAVNEKNSM